MKSSALALVAAAILAGCATHHHRNECQCASVDLVHMNPQVTVRADVIAVAPDPLIFERGERDFRIVWRLPQGDLKFPANGIVIDGELIDSSTKREIGPGRERAKKVKEAQLQRDQDQIIDCRPSSDGRSFSCLNKHSRPGVFRYTIRVERKGETLQSDPTMMND